MADEALQKAIMEVYRWTNQNIGSFQNKLFGLIHMADATNRARLRVAFPVECKAYNMWEQSADEDEFFKEHLSEGSRKRKAEWKEGPY